MSDFGIQIKVDPSGAPAAIQSVIKPLEQAEALGPAVGAAISQGMRQAKTEATAASQAFASVATAIKAGDDAYKRIIASQNEQLASMEATTRASSTWQAALIRERDILEQINGPTKKLAETTAALDSLMAKGAISAKQYTAALAQAKATASGGGGSGSASGINALASQFGLGGMGSMVGTAGVAAVAAFGVRELAEIDDKYTDLRNSALRFVDADHSVNQVLADQRVLARSLHQDLGQSMEAYERVRVSVDDVNLSYDQGLRLTKTYTEAAVLNGRATEDLAQQMENLKVAFDTGTDASRPMRAIFKEFPALATQWEHSLGLTEKQILQMGKSGKLTFDQLINASITATDSIDGKFGQRVKTWRQSWDELKDDVERPIDIQATMAQLEKQMHPFENTLDRLKKKFIDFRTTVGGAAADSTISDFAGLRTALADLGTGASTVLTHYDELAKHIGIVDPWKVATDAAKKYDDQLAKVRETLDKMIDAANHIPSKSAGMLGEEAAATGAGTYIAGIGPQMTTQQEAARRYRLELSQLIEMQNAYGLSDVQVAEKQAQINAEYNKGIGAIDAQTQRQKELQSMLDAIKKPQQDYARDLDIVNQLYADGAINADEYAAKVNAIHLAYDNTQKHSQDFVTGLERGWDQIEKSTLDVAHSVETAFKTAFDNLNNTLTDFITTGTADWSKFASSIEADLVKIALQMAERQAITGLVSAIGGGRTGFDYMTPSGPGPALPGFATGGDMLVNGHGPPDSKLAMFRVSPGESIHVRTPEQRAAAAASGGGGGSTLNQYNFNYDPKAFRGMIQDEVRAEMQRNPAVYRALLGR